MHPLPPLDYRTPSRDPRPGPHPLDVVALTLAVLPLVVTAVSLLDVLGTAGQSLCCAGLPCNLAAWGLLTYRSTHQSRNSPLSRRLWRIGLACAILYYPLLVLSLGGLALLARYRH